MSWSKALPLTPEFRLKVPAEPGVYRIRALDPHDQPVPIQRLSGTDNEGILHIGQSRNVKVRLYQFYQSAKHGNKNHHAGNEFFSWGFAKLFPLETLTFDYVLTESRERAIERERELHVRYRQRYWDRPPLDGTSGQVK